MLFRLFLKREILQCILLIISIALSSQNDGVSINSEANSELPAGFTMK